MDTSIHRKLLKTIDEYYPTGSPSTTNWSNRIKEIVQKKIDAESEFTLRWENLVKKLRDNGLSIQNHSYLQFPNLMLTVEQSEKLQDVIVYKNLAICYSLLCPFYTLYYEYRHKVRINDGLLPLNGFVFQLKKDFDSLKSSASIEDIKGALQSNFSEYSFVDHYALMVNKLPGRTPYGLDWGGVTSEYSFYQFLFNKEQPDSNSIFP